MTIFLNTYPIFLWVIFLILLADFISGLGHWFEDVYGNPDWPLLGKYVVQPNIQHHQTPRSFLVGSYWYRNSTVFIPCIVLFIICAFTNLLCRQVVFFLLYLSQVNEVHAISHRRKSENWLFFQWLQKIGLIQSALHHGWHHKAPYDCNYCIMTEYLNPILNKIYFWTVLECGLSFFGIQPYALREDIK